MRRTAVFVCGARPVATIRARVSGHRLDDDGNFPADSDVADADGWSFSAGDFCHVSSLPKSSSQFVVHSSQRTTKSKQQTAS